MAGTQVGASGDSLCSPDESVTASSDFHDVSQVSDKVSGSPVALEGGVADK